MTLEELGVEVHEMAVRKGWWEQPRSQRIPRLCKWLHEEACELRDAWATGGNTAWTSIDAEGLEKPEGVPSELADIYLIVADIAHGLGIDLVAAAREKLSYNQVRKYKRDKTGEPQSGLP